jgi:hypothetical protein
MVKTRTDGIVRSAGPAQKARYDLSKILDLYDVNIQIISFRSCINQKPSVRAIQNRAQKCHSVMWGETVN